MTRLTTVHDRFEVGDPVCGRIDGFTSRREALLAARRHEQIEGCKVTVFDVMARRGAADSWDSRGWALTQRIRRRKPCE